MVTWSFMAYPLVAALAATYAAWMASVKTGVGTPTVAATVEVAAVIAVCNNRLPRSASVSGPAGMVIGTTHRSTMATISSSVLFGLAPRS